MSKSEKLNLVSAHISKGLCERILTLSAAETALATEDSDTQSEDDDASVSEDSEIEDELLQEFGDASNSDENDSKDSESEEEDELPEGARVNRYGRQVGNWRLCYSSQQVRLCEGPRDRCTFQPQTMFVRRKGWVTINFTASRGGSHFLTKNIKGGLGDFTFMLIGIPPAHPPF